MNPLSDKKRYTASRSVAAMGANISLVSCLRCGASLTFDPEDEKTGVSVGKLHDSWHDHFDRLKLT